MINNLEEYRKKRVFPNTPELKATSPYNIYRIRNKPRFVIHKHDATRLHYDIRLESKKEQVLKSWAVPKGISLDPKIKRLAILTEDHPLDYLLFEGIIPAGNYGAGTVIVWDIGTFDTRSTNCDIHEQFKDGKIEFTLYGQKLKGKFSLIKMNWGENQWLIIKGNDKYVSTKDLTITSPESVFSENVEVTKKI